MVYSHYESDEDNKLLTDHLGNVADRVEKFLGEDLEEIGYISAFLHDIGKCDPKFQSYLIEDNDEQVSHAPFGCLCTYYVCKESGFDKVDALMAGVAVYHHHRELPNDRLRDFMRKNIKGRSDEIIEKIDRINSENRETSESIFSDLGCDWSEFCDEIRDNGMDFIINDFIDIKPSSPEDVDYYDLLTLWSSLNLADKSDAMQLSDEYIDYRTPNLNAFRDYMDSEVSVESSLDELRDEAASSIDHNTQDMIDENIDIGTIELPTGMGKTLSGLRAALLLAREYDSNIIYTLPFTSIIDQTSDTMDDIFSETDQDVVVHHHLANTQVENKEVTEKKYKSFLGKSWSSEFILTTYVQLLETLIGPRNYQSVKIPNIRNSVIILDEPQSIPHDWWSLLRDRVSEILIDKYDCKVVSMTATHPHIFESSEHETKELVDNPEKYFKKDELTRVEYNVDDSFWSGIEEPNLQVRELAKKVLDDDRKNKMIICNTIDSSKQLTEEINNRKDFQILNETDPDSINPDKPILANLTSRHRPKDRLNMIQRIKNVKDMENEVILVCTQIIQAGVDISFESVYRDMAPLDSIVQAAGRCNRNNEMEMGQVYLYSLEDEEGNLPSNKIYREYNENDLINTTLESCKEEVGEKPNLTQKEMNYNCVHKYYELLKKRDIGKKEYKDYIDNTNTKELNRLSLIEDDVKSADVVIAKTEKEKDTVEEIRENYADNNYKYVRKLRKQLNDTIVSIPLYSNKEKMRLKELPNLLLEEGTKTRCLKEGSTEYDEFYDELYGLSLESEQVAKII